MKTTTHVAADEAMAWLDGELGEDAARAVETHVEECAECRATAAGFRRLAEELAEWRVDEVPEKLDAKVMKAVESWGRPVRVATAKRVAPRGGGRRWGLWVTSGAVALVVVMVVPGLFQAHKSPSSYSTMAPSETQTAGLPLYSQEARRPAANMRAASTGIEENGAERKMLSKLEPPSYRGNGAGGGAPANMAVPAGPMIARTVSLTARVKDVEMARPTLESVVARHHGYVAQMTSNMAVGSARVFTASVRIPAGELAAALAAMRGVGKVETETQTGEEVTQQHQDLAARLKTSRETEARFQGILTQRTGSVSDVLEVEQEIARVRGEIESMEAEQAGLEHRVEFASVEVTLMEVHKEEFAAEDSVGTQMRNALVEGLRNGRGTVVGMVVFVEEYAPVLLIWAVVLGMPGVWVWRRYRKVQAGM